ncbi:hypothetical protein JQX13_22010 [Archangium violaceum]|uniref:hypothetical protein n=1 Tax=Archangium violaceum TaxID=83451 RepID=UPI00193B4210|nr:hypothetical protein [Archangium violaceum]QRK12461.1 hypothetical protein JQX13_22010 [Archangium violaceum]
MKDNRMNKRTGAPAAHRFGPGRGRRRWIAGGLLVGVAVLLYGATRWRRAPDVESTPSSPQAILEAAAENRFASVTPRIPSRDGKMRPVTDERQVKALKVMHLKEVLAKEELAQDPEFELRAEERLREQRPAAVKIEWQTPAGNEWIETIVADTVGCGLADLTEPKSFTLEQFQKLSCLYYENEELWKGVATSVTVSQTPIEEYRPEWEQLKSEQMRNMAAISFIERSQRQRKAQECGHEALSRDVADLRCCLRMYRSRTDPHRCRADPHRVRPGRAPTCRSEQRVV